MLLAKNFFVLVFLTAGVCDAIKSSDRDTHLRTTRRDLYGYESPYTESVVVKENKMKDDKEDSPKMKGAASNVMHFAVSSSEDYGYSSKYSSSEDSTASQVASRGRGSVKKKKTSPIITRKPRPFKKPSNFVVWKGDGYKPTNKPTKAPIEPVVTPQPTWSDDGYIYTPEPTTWNGDGYKPTNKPTKAPIEPVVTPQPTWSDDGHTPEPTDWKDDGFEPIVTDEPTR